MTFKLLTKQSDFGTGSGAGPLVKKNGKFKAKELDGQILSVLSAFQKQCEKFSYSRDGFWALGREMTGLFQMAREQNEKLKLHIEETPIVSNRYEMSFDLRISDKPNPDIRWDYNLHVLLIYSRDSGKITVSAECNAPSLHWNTKINKPDEGAFFDSLKTALIEVRNFSGDYATSPLFVKALKS